MISHQTAALAQFTDPHAEIVERAEKILDVSFADKRLLIDALRPGHQHERLEWLGDRVVNYAVFRAQLISLLQDQSAGVAFDGPSNDELAWIAEQSGLEDLYMESLPRNVRRLSVKKSADAVQAVIGAIAVGQGTRAAEQAITRLYAMAGQSFPVTDLTAGKALALLPNDFPINVSLIQHDCFPDDSTGKVRPKWAQVREKTSQALDILGGAVIRYTTAWGAFCFTAPAEPLISLEISNMRLRSSAKMMLQSSGAPVHQCCDPLALKDGIPLPARCRFGLIGLAGVRFDAPPQNPKLIECAIPRDENALRQKWTLEQLEQHQMLDVLRNDTKEMQRQLDAMVKTDYVVIDRPHGVQVDIYAGLIPIGGAVAELLEIAKHQAVSAAHEFLSSPEMLKIVRSGNITALDHRGPNFKRDYVAELEIKLALLTVGKIEYDVKNRPGAPAPHRYMARIRAHTKEKPLGKGEGKTEEDAKQQAAKAALELVESSNNPLKPKRI